MRWPWTICFAAAKDPLGEVWIGSLGVGPRRARDETIVSERERRGRKNFDLAGRGGSHDVNQQEGSGFVRWGPEIGQEETNELHFSPLFPELKRALGISEAEYCRSTRSGSQKFLSSKFLSQVQTTE